MNSSGDDTTSNWNSIDSKAQTSNLTGYYTYLRWNCVGSTVQRIELIYMLHIFELKLDWTEHPYINALVRVLHIYDFIWISPTLDRTSRFIELKLNWTDSENKRLDLDVTHLWIEVELNRKLHISHRACYSIELKLNWSGILIGVESLKLKLYWS